MTMVCLKGLKCFMYDRVRWP